MIKIKKHRKEIWRDVAGYEKRYMVSNHGRVKSKAWVFIRSDGKPYRNKSRILTTANNSHGYPSITIKKGKVKFTAVVHILVATAFLDNPENKPYVLHKDGTRDNNHVDNLYWGTPIENHNDAVRHGTYTVDNRGELNGKSKLKVKDVKRIRRMLREGRYSQSEIARMYGVASSWISLINSRKAWRHV